MKVLVSDLILLGEVQKQGLLAAFIGLPYEIYMTCFLYEDLKQESYFCCIDDGCIEIVHFDAHEMEDVEKTFGYHPHITVKDAAALVAAVNVGCILISRSAPVRAVAKKMGVRCEPLPWSLSEVKK